MSSVWNKKGTFLVSNTMRDNLDSAPFVSDRTRVLLEGREETLNYLNGCSSNTAKVNRVMGNHFWTSKMTFHSFHSQSLVPFARPISIRPRFRIALWKLDSEHVNHSKCLWKVFPTSDGFGIIPSTCQRSPNPLALVFRFWLRCSNKV